MLLLTKMVSGLSVCIIVAPSVQIYVKFDTGNFYNKLYMKTQVHFIVAGDISPQQCFKQHGITLLG